MTSTAALSGAVARVRRVAAGRRVLYVALLVGGLFALGFLCGEQARAADGPVVPHAVEGAGPQTTDAPARSTTLPPPTLTPKPTPAPSPARPLPSSPVGDAVTTVLDGLAEVTGAVTAGVTTGIPPLSSLPALPALPGLPGLPSLPGLPAWPTLPTPPSESTPPTLPSPPGLPSSPSLPGPSEPPTLPTSPSLPALPWLPGLPGHAPSASQPQAGDPGRVAGERHGHPASAGAEERQVAYGPVLAVGAGDTARRVARDGGHRGAGAEYAPVRRAPGGAPGGEPGGALGSRAVVDGAGSRQSHGDAHAVVVDRLAPVRLVPGAAARHDVAEIRNRYRDIPVSPA